MRAAAVILATVALATAGCGSDKSDSSSTTDWANDVCSAVSTYSNSVRDAATSLQENISRAGFDAATKQVQEATDTFTDEIESLGKPQTDAGDRGKTTLDTLSKQLNDDLDSAQAAKGDGLVQGLSTVTDALAAAQTQIRAAVNELEGLDAQGELSEAFKSASACDSLR